MREVNGSELLEGSDHEFVVNLYTMVLNRWPDEEGYRHHLQKVENRPDIRRQVIRDVAASDEGRALGVVVLFEDEAPAAAPAPVPAAPAASLPDPAAPAPGGNLAATLAALKDGLAGMDAAALAQAQALLADALAAIAAQRAERIEARLALLEQRLG